MDDRGARVKLEYEPGTNYTLIPVGNLEERNVVKKLKDPGKAYLSSQINSSH